MLLTSPTRDHERFQRLKQPGNTQMLILCASEPSSSPIWAEFSNVEHASSLMKMRFLQGILCDSPAFRGLSVLCHGCQLLGHTTLGRIILVGLVYSMTKPTRSRTLDSILRTGWGELHAASPKHSGVSSITDIGTN